MTRIDPSSILNEITPAQPVVVLGGGMSGLTTAWELQRLGVPVRVVEQTPHRGGRIQSVVEGEGRVETGMQFYYSAYREARRLLRELDLHRELVPIHIRGQIFWEDRIAPFSKSWPWLKLLSAGDNFRLQLAVARRLFDLLRMSVFDYAGDDPLDRIDAVEYFTRHGNEAIIEVAIRPLVNSYAFCEPEGHSLAMLLRIVKLGGLAKTYGLARGNDSLPQAMAKRLIVTHGRAQEVLIEGGRVEGVVVEHESGRVETIETGCVVSALPGPAATQVLRGAPAVAQGLADLSYSTIVLANLHLDRALEGRDWVYVLSRQAGHQAAFAIDLLRRSPGMFPAGKSVIQVDFASPVSDRLLASDDATIVEQAIRDMQAFLPEIAEWVVDSSVVRRPRAHPNFRCGTFAAVRALQAQAARVEGLYLAGDYLRSPLCEGAVRSGLQAVEQLKGPRTHTPSASGRPARVGEAVTV